MIPMEQLGEQGADTKFAARWVLTRKRPVDPRDDPAIGRNQRLRIKAALDNCQHLANLSDRKRPPEVVVDVGEGDNDDTLPTAKRRLRGKQPRRF